MYIYHVLMPSRAFIVFNMHTYRNEREKFALVLMPSRAFIVFNPAET